MRIVNGHLYQQINVVYVHKSGLLEASKINYRKPALKSSCFKVMLLFTFTFIDLADAFIQSN